MLKTTLAALLAVCWTVAPAEAQGPPPPGGAPMPAAATATPRPRFGVTAGVNLATLRSDEFDGIDVSSKIGLAVGGVYVMPINPNVAVVIEGIATQKGASLSDDSGAEADVSYLYLEAPVSIAYSFPSGGNMTPYLFGGAAISMFISGEISSGGESQDLDDVNSIDYGVLAGAGVFMTTGSGATIYGSLKYTLGLNDIADEGTGSAQHAVISAMGGYLF